jgi:hypothetical protein
MRRRPATAALIASGILGLTIASTRAEPCSSAIAQFEQATRHSARNAGVSAPQSIGAQLHHQPTRESVARAEGMAQADLEKALARAKALNAEGREGECMQALSQAKLMFGSE